MADLQRGTAQLGDKTSSVHIVRSALRSNHRWISGSTYARVASGNKSGFSLQQLYCPPDVANRFVHLSAFAAFPQRTYHALLHSLHSSPRTLEFCASSAHFIAGRGASLDMVASQSRSPDQLFCALVIDLPDTDSLPSRFSCRQRGS